MLDGDGVPPEGWVVQPLSACVDVLDSRRKPVNLKDRAARPGSIPYYGATGQVGWIDDYLFDEELVLLGEDGAPFLDKSKPIAYVINGKSWVNNHAHVLRARSDVTTNRYIKHYLDSFDFSDRVQGSTRDKLTQRSMNSIPVLVAPRPIQDALVARIESVVSLRGTASDHLSAARLAIDRFRRAVLAAACSSRLTADWRLTHAILDSAGDELPGGWAVASGREAFPFVTSGSRGWAKYYSDEGPAFIRVGNLDHDRLDLDLSEVQRVTPPDNAEAKRTAVRPGDLLISITAEIGMVGVAPEDLGPAHVNQHVAIARPDPTLNSRYMACFVAAQTGGQLQLAIRQRGATKAGLGLDDIRALEIPIPPRAEQDEIVRRVNHLLSLAEGLTKRIDAALKQVDRSSQAVLAKAFRGELIVEANGNRTGV